MLSNSLSSQGDSLAMRTVSGFHLSIGTSLAFESLFLHRQTSYDPNYLPPQMVNLTQYDECWINLSTMFRNMVGSITKEAYLHTKEESFVETLLEEIELIEDLFRGEGHDLIQPVFYYMDYQKLKTSLPKQLRWRDDKTDNQRAYNHMHDKVLKLLRKKTDLIPEFNTEIRPPKPTRSLIITHQGYDLLSFRHFDKLTLLESHTGKLKERNLWYTKYAPVGEADLSNIPFQRKLFLIFGDKNLIQPSDFKLRKQITEIAVQRQWTSHTTEAKVMFDLELGIMEPYVLAFLKSL